MIVSALLRSTRFEKRELDQAELESAGGCVLDRDAVVKRARAHAELELYSHAVADRVHDLSARADYLPLSTSSPHAVLHDGRCRGARIDAAGHTFISWAAGA
jgi:hypothetical protein